MLWSVYFSNAARLARKKKDSGIWKWQMTHYHTKSFSTSFIIRKLQIQNVIPLPKGLTF